MTSRLMRSLHVNAQQGKNQRLSDAIRHHDYHFKSLTYFVTFALLRANVLLSISVLHEFASVKLLSSMLPGW